MNNDERPGIYLFRGDALVTREDAEGPTLGEAVPEETVREVFNPVDVFEVPPVRGGGMIRAAVLAGDLPETWKAVPVRQAIQVIAGESMAGSGGPAGRLLRAFHIAQWRRDSVYCGTCGGKNRDALSGELARECPRCGRLEFPRISPAVITLITNDRGEALLAHNRKFSGGVYSLIAGFNEAGESLEDTVAREIREEVNIEVKDVRYVRSQPWPFPNSLMLGFSAVYSGGILRPDGVEIEDARWFSRENLPPLPGNGSVSRYLIGLWLAGKTSSTNQLTSGLKKM